MKYLILMILAVTALIVQISTRDYGITMIILYLYVIVNSVFGLTEESK